MPNYILLLPPSEGKMSGGSRLFSEVFMDLSFTSLAISRTEFLNQLRKNIEFMDDRFLSKVFDITSDKAVFRKNQLINLFSEPTTPAISRYNGVMFKAISYETLDEVSKKNFDESVIFVDGLFGLLRPKDMICDYKLKINAKIGTLNASQFWGVKLKPIFEELFANNIVIDILPTAHRRVIDYSSAKNHFVVTFAEIVNGKLKQTGHFSKKLKGEFVRYVTTKDNISFEDLRDFKHSEGYFYDEKYSWKNEIVYVKR